MNSSATHRRRHVRKVERAGYSQNGGNTGTTDSSVAIPIDAEIVVWMIGGYDSDTTDRVGEVCTLTVDYGGDDTVVTPIGASNINANGRTCGLAIADVRPYRGTTITFRETVGGSWTSGAGMHTFAFYKRANINNIPSSCWVGDGYDAVNNNGAARSTGSMTTAPNGMAVCHYTAWNTGTPTWTGVDREISTFGPTNSQWCHFAEADTDGTNLTVTGDGGTYHDVSAVCLTPI